MDGLPGRGMQAAFRDVVERDHVDVRAHTGELFRKQLRLLRRVADTIDHGVFEGDAAPRLRKIVAAACRPASGG